VTTRTLTPPAGVAQAYANKHASYFAGARLDFVAMLPEDPTAKILEIGCGTGRTGALALARGRAGEYVGIELFDAAATEAREVLTGVITADVEKLDFNSLGWQPARFDALILSEVLEHLVDPGQVLKKVARYIRPGGVVLASSPNVSHWRVIRELFYGRFNLADQGVFDRTHMRWFTPTTFADMFEDAGFRVVRLQPVTPFAPRTELISRLTNGRYDHLFMAQISIAALRR
jgi:2-polyprenyl-3-methyl-5-hydroxy-6-metoxy-1,4-benzoquinol methylase